MNAKIKDRLLTAAAVGLICLGGFSTSGCAGNRSQQYQYPVSIIKVHSYECTTDFDCEMHERTGTTHSEWTWKKVAIVAGSMLVTGYLLSREFDDAGANRGLDVKTPRVNCDVAGRPGLGCAQ